MTLSISSILHNWSSRFGPMAVVGGKPVHARSTAGQYTDQQGIVQSAIVNTPRLNWETLGGERRQLMTLEQAGTNSMLHSEDFTNAAWTKGSVTVTSGVPDPKGGNTACTLTATGASGFAVQSLSASSSIGRTNSMWVRRRTGTGDIQLNDPNNDNYHSRTITDQWTRIAFPSTGPYTAATGRWLGIKIITSGDAIDVWGGQQDDGPLTSYTATVASPVTRSADSFYWDFFQPPQGLMAYLRFIEMGTVGITGGALMQVGDVLAGDPKLLLYAPSGVYRAFHNNGVSFVTCDATAAPSYGLPVEIVVLLQPGGQVGLIQSVNGAAATQNANSGPLALASHWAGTVMTLGCIGAGNAGVAEFAEVKVVKYADVVASSAQGILDELRGFELGANQQVL